MEAKPLHGWIYFMIYIVVLYSFNHIYITLKQKRIIL